MHQILGMCETGHVGSNLDVWGQTEATGVAQIAFYRIRFFQISRSRFLRNDLAQLAILFLQEVLADDHSNVNIKNGSITKIDSPRTVTSRKGT